MSRGLKIALVAVLTLLVLGVGGLTAYIFLIQKPALAAAGKAPAAAAQAKESPAEADANEKVEEPFFFKTKNFVTDLADKDRGRYVDVTVAIQVSDEAAVESVKPFEPQIRDVILSQLRGKAAADLVGAAGKDRLADELNKALQPLLKKQFKKVYITDLVIQ